MANPKVTWNYYDDADPALVVPKLERFIHTRIERHKPEFWYVGQTLHHDPRQRLGQHEATLAAGGQRGWDEMFVIYAHRDLGFVAQVEARLIRYLEASHPAKRGKGLWNAGPGIYANAREFFVYVLVEWRRTKKKWDYRENADFITRQDARSDAPETALDRVKQKFRAATRPADPQKDGPCARWVYVGVTNAPARRFAQHQKRMEEDEAGQYWHEMRLLYRTPNLTSAYWMEGRLIDYAKGSPNYRDHLYNTQNGRLQAFMDGQDELEPYGLVYYLEDRGGR